MSIVYLTTDEVGEINRQVLGNSKPAIVRFGDLDSAVNSPKHSMFGEDLYPTIFDKASALLRGIAMNHAFADGNKRTAFVSMCVFLEMNNIRYKWTDDEAIQMIDSLVVNRWSVEQIVEWLKNHCR